MNENYFMFRERYVKTTSGVAMGNPLFPLTSEIFMSPIEQKGNRKKSCIRYNEPPTLGSLTRNEKLYITANKNGYDNKMIEFMMKK